MLRDGQRITGGAQLWAMAPCRAVFGCAALRRPKLASRHAAAAPRLVRVEDGSWRSSLGATRAHTAICIGVVAQCPLANEDISRLSRQS